MQFIIQSKEDWHAQRAQGVGGSDIAAICGEDTYRTPLDVYLDKIGEGVPFEGNKFTEAGTVLEPVVAQWFTQKTGIELVSAPQGLIGLKPHYRVNIDRLTTDNEVVEIKTTQLRLEEPLDKWRIQATWGAGIFGAKAYWIVWLERGVDLKYKRFEFDEELFSILCDEADRFWQLVETRTPPDPKLSSEFTAKYGETIEASQTLQDKFLRLRALKEKAAEDKEEIELLTEEIKLVMGTAEALTINGAVVATWKQSKARELIDSKALKSERPEIYAQFLKQSEVPRPFVVK
jgi:putative phage-type endonuclease